MTSFLLEMGDIFRRDGSLMSVCSLRPAESAAELSHAETSPLSQICETLQRSNQIRLIPLVCFLQSLRHATLEAANVRFI